MTPDAAPLDDEPWVIPLHGAIAPSPLPEPTKTIKNDDEALTDHFYGDDELPTIEFRPQLRKSA